MAQPLWRPLDNKEPLYTTVLQQLGLLMGRKRDPRGSTTSGTRPEPKGRPATATEAERPWHPLDGLPVKAPTYLTAEDIHVLYGEMDQRTGAVGQRFIVVEQPALPAEECLLVMQTFRTSRVAVLVNARMEMFEVRVRPTEPWFHGLSAMHGFLDRGDPSAGDTAQFLVADVFAFRGVHARHSTFLQRRLFLSGPMGVVPGCSIPDTKAEVTAESHAALQFLPLCLLPHALFPEWPPLTSPTGLRAAAQEAQRVAASVNPDPRSAAYRAAHAAALARTKRVGGLGTAYWIRSEMDFATRWSMHGAAYPDFFFVVAHSAADCLYAVRARLEPTIPALLAPGSWVPSSSSSVSPASPSTEPPRQIALHLDDPWLPESVASASKPLVLGADGLPCEDTKEPRPSEALAHVAWEEVAHVLGTRGLTVSGAAETWEDAQGPVLLCMVQEGRYTPVHWATHRMRADTLDTFRQTKRAQNQGVTVDYLMRVHQLALQSRDRSLSPEAQDALLQKISDLVPGFAPDTEVGAEYLIALHKSWPSVSTPRTPGTQMSHETKGAAKEQRAARTPGADYEDSVDKRADALYLDSVYTTPLPDAKVPGTLWFDEYTEPPGHEPSSASSSVSSASSASSAPPAANPNVSPPWTYKVRTVLSAPEMTAALQAAVESLYDGRSPAVGMVYDSLAPPDQVDVARRELSAGALPLVIVRQRPDGSSDVVDLTGPGTAVYV